MKQNKKRSRGLISPKPAQALRDGPLAAPLPPKDRSALNEFIQKYQLSHEAITRMTGFSLRAVTNWNQGAKPSASTARRLTEIKRLFTSLERLVSPEAISEWLRDPNPAFDGSTPVQVIERGESDRLWRMIYELESGEPV